MRSRRTLIAALAVLALVAMGCGGGDDDSTESTATTAAAPAALTQAELIEQGDAICAEVNAAVGTVSAGSTTTESPAAQVANLYSGMVESLENLGAPQESDGYADFSAAADELATAQNEVELASERGEAAGLEEAESNAAAALSSFQSAAQEYGFEECGEGPSAPPVTAAPESGEAEAGEEAEAIEPEAIEPEAEEPAPEVAPETGGAGGTPEGGGTSGGGESGGGTGGGGSGGIGPG